MPTHVGVAARGVLVLIGLALFIAIGPNPAVSRCTGCLGGDPAAATVRLLANQVAFPRLDRM